MLKDQGKNDSAVRVCSATAWEVHQVRTQILLHTPNDRPSAYLEIGAFRGGSLWNYGGALLPGSLLIAVDKPLLHAGDQLADVAHRLRHAGGYRVEIVTGDSHDEVTLQRVAELAGHEVDGVDVLLIDGDHSPAGCQKDLEMYTPLVRAGGLVILHDVGSPCGGAKAPAAELSAVLSGLHPVWREWATGRRSLLVQEWAGYGMFWM